MIKFDIKNRWTGEVKFTAEIDCAEDAPLGIKIRLAVRWKIEQAVAADLTAADLTRANLTRADLKAAKRDFFAILLTAVNEIGFLRQALIDGQVDGSTYHGDCCCLVGTIARGRNCEVTSLEMDSTRPAERLFMAIKKRRQTGNQCRQQNRLAMD